MVADGRRLIKYQQNTPTLIVQPGKGLGVFFRPRDRVGAPQPLVHGVRGVHRRRSRTEPMPMDCQPQPLDDLRPGLGSQLRLGVRRHDNASVGHRRQRPDRHPRRDRRFADPVPARPGNADRFATFTQPLSETFEQFCLPGARPGSGDQLGPVLAPRKCESDKAERIVRERCDLIDKIPLDINPGHHVLRAPGS